MNLGSTQTDRASKAARSERQKRHKNPSGDTNADAAPARTEEPEISREVPESSTTPSRPGDTKKERTSFFGEATVEYLGPNDEHKINKNFGVSVGVQSGDSKISGSIQRKREIPETSRRRTSGEAQRDVSDRRSFSLKIETTPSKRDEGEKGPSREESKAERSKPKSVWWEKTSAEKPSRRQRADEHPRTSSDPGDIVSQGDPQRLRCDPEDSPIEDGEGGGRDGGRGGGRGDDKDDPRKRRHRKPCVTTRTRTTGRVTSEVSINTRTGTVQNEEERRGDTEVATRKHKHKDKQRSSDPDGYKVKEKSTSREESHTSFDFVHHLRRQTIGVRRTTTTNSEKLVTRHHGHRRRHSSGDRGHDRDHDRRHSRDRSQGAG